MQVLASTDFEFQGYKTRKYSGKVRDVYTIDEQVLVFVATDRISAFDVILPQAIPYKGQVLNQLAAYFLEATRDICRNHLLATPDPNVTIGLKTEAYPIEMVVRGYLCGHAWRVYRDGGRSLCGVSLPDGLQENDPLPQPIITPSTKSSIGHDEDISRDEIVRSGLVPAMEYAQLEHYALQLFQRGTEMAAERGLILADTKYEFGYRNMDIYLIDEIHTPDSSRYFVRQGYTQARAAGRRPEQMSKEFVREWLMAQGFRGQEGTQPPTMPADFVQQVSEKYIAVYEQVTGQAFRRRPETPSLATDVQAATQQALAQILREA
ncbi:MAG: phosphoribosylaminoimidazolesuccinocarboxamide synthase [Bacteroidetes bacterium]|nr:phosphoribosylaminoimidazolesuccinocarboxamide synthase [Bacteroidota bacterium]